MQIFIISYSSVDVNEIGCQVPITQAFYCLVFKLYYVLIHLCIVYTY